MPAFVYLVLFFLLPKVGLVDARALPQTLLFLLIAGSTTVYYSLNFFKKFIQLASVPILTILNIIWIMHHVDTLSVWMKWNYSGWQAKKHYPHIQSISNALEPGFDKPRVIYEHHPDLTQAGTTRVFEMLPYFANRSTMEGLYLQSSLLTPVSLYLQSKISVKPSCAVKEYKCSKQNFKTLKNKMNLNAVSSIIVYTEDPKKSADLDPDFSLHSKHGPYNIYSLYFEPDYAIALTGTVDVIEYKETWKHKMYEWFVNYDGEDSWKLVNLPWLNNKTFVEAVEKNKIKTCKTNVEVNFSGFKFYTDCPNVPHLLKFAYMDSFKNSSDLPMYLLAPGMIGFIPKKQQTIFEFGKKLSWVVANYVSVLSFLFMLVGFYRFRK